MNVSTSLRIVVAAVLVSSSAFAQESRLEEIVVTSTALARAHSRSPSRPPSLQATTARQISTSIGETLSQSWA